MPIYAIYANAIPHALVLLRCGSSSDPLLQLLPLLCVGYPQPPACGGCGCNHRKLLMPQPLMQTGTCLVSQSAGLLYMTFSDDRRMQVDSRDCRRLRCRLVIMTGCVILMLISGRQSIRLALQRTCTCCVSTWTGRPAGRPQNTSMCGGSKCLNCHCATAANGRLRCMLVYCTRQGDSAVRLLQARQPLRRPAAMPALPGHLEM